VPATIKVETLTKYTANNASDASERTSNVRGVIAKPPGETKT
jgi:hypothetical protein